MPKPMPRRLDPRSPLVLDTRDLPRRPGAMRTVDRTVPAPAGFGLAMIEAGEGTELDLHLRMESVSEGVLVSGTVSAPVRGECGRCLRPIGWTLNTEIQELYAYADSTTDETTDDEEVGRLEGDLIDVEPAVRDMVVLALPSNPLCRVDCPGLCPDCGVPLDELPRDHGHERVDSRWAALSKLRTVEE
ncbi:MAG: DUF177 domain-containing protein [Dactylosporangium sp.]|nr:DUF177 domain-containing protein [Dactylosporangium sp.]NNJ63335.1 DUF177 domain-containing protein [Dactylosporangium sp.]